MEIKTTTVVFDAADLDAESGFWAAVTGGTVDKDQDWHTITTDGPLRLAVQLAPNHQPPQWPDGLPQQMHVDLRVDDVEVAEAEVLRLGARRLRAVDEENWRVYADPAGHPFCLCWDPQ